MGTPTKRHEQVAEILKCGKDPIHFIRHHCKIQHPLKGMIPFETYDFQDDCVRDFVKHRFNIVLKSRQLGLSTVTAAYVAWLAYFHKEKNILVIATKLGTAMNFIKKIKVILKSLPPWMKLTTYEDNRQEIRFANGSYIQAIPTSDDAGRSEALSLLIVDEAAWVKNFDDLWTGLYPTLSTGGSAIILSTPNGVGGQYYQLYQGAIAKSNEFNPIKLLWDVHPEHDQAWFDKESKQLSKRKVKQELLCEFLGSGDTFINADDIAWLESIQRDPIAHGDGIVERDVWVWKHPELGHKYVLSADVSRGDGKDYSTFHILDASSAEIVCEFMGKLPPDKFGQLLNKWGLKYNKALVCPENNTFGNHTSSELRRLNYPFLMYEKAKPSQIETFIPTEDDRVGFSTQAKSREQALSKFEELIRNKIVRSYSSRLISQLRTFIWNGNKATAMKHEHDDLVMSTAIGCWLFDAIYGKPTGDTSYTRVLLETMSRSSTNFSSVPGNGQEAQPLTRPQLAAANVYRPRAPTNPDAIDFSWLLS